ncbi:hypothetical protein [Streptomonospora wellingtoniae]|uniref:RanBP2-type domain-containing protein n=1 Tax=Streptomonospora wellingtoniae TaxID=3075544 RepID=A0ABU2KVH7_9ACTN|nr:hypothetical protein [Streptomonospora sp. DSM 45055]MDT0303301.1 hypothetical protein [Streptomonospora sp. DSM 45055]
MREPSTRTGPVLGSALIVRNWTCRLCTYSNPDSEDICCQRCGAAKK